MLRRLFGNPLMEWFVLILAVIAGITAVKFMVSYIPSNGGLLGGIKATILSV